MNFNLNLKPDPKLIQLAIRTHLVVWAGILAALWLVAATGVVGHFKKKIDYLDMQNAGLSNQVKETEAFMTAMPDIDAALKEQEDTLKKLEQKMLKPGEHARVVSAVADATKSNNIVLKSLKPVFSDRKEKARLENKRLLPTYFELTMPARYQQAGEFFEYLEALPLFLAVMHFDIAADPARPNVLNADVTLAAFEEAPPAVPLPPS